jgi:hypothetical protein
MGDKIRNPKHEVRNNFQPETSNTETAAPWRPAVRRFDISSPGLRICFGFRASCFGFRTFSGAKQKATARKRWPSESIEPAARVAYAVFTAFMKSR